MGGEEEMLDKVKGLFKRKGGKKKYVIQIPRQGGAVVLGTIEADTPEELNQALMEMLEEAVEQGDYLVKQAKYVHIIDADSGQKIRKKNPFYVKEEDEDAVTKKKQATEKEPTPQEIINYALLDTTVNIIKTTIPSLMNMMLKGLGEAYAELGKEMAKAAIQREQTSKLAELAQFIRALIDLANNYPKVKKMIREVSKEEAFQVLLGGVGGGKATESSRGNVKAEKEG